MTVPVEGGGLSFDENADTHNLVDAGRRIHAELIRRPSRIMSFSPKARERLEILYSEYLGDLGQESIRLARQNNLSTVDDYHVIEANTRIGGPSRRSGIVTATNTVGGVVAGAGIASVYTIMFSAGPHGQPEILTALILCVLGFTLLAVSMTTTFVRRL